MQQEEHLLSLTGYDLKDLAQQIGLSRLPTRKADIVQAILAKCRGTDGSLLGEADSGLKAVLSQLPQELQCLIAEAAYHKSVNARAFMAKYEISSVKQLTENIGDTRRRTWLGTVFLKVEDDGQILLCDDLRAEVRKLLPKPPRPVLRVTDSLPASVSYSDWVFGQDAATEGRPVQVYEGGTTVLTELGGVLSLVQYGKLKVAPKSGRLSASSERLLADVLVQPDFALDVPETKTKHDRRYQYENEACGPVRGHAWGVLVQQCGWARVRGGALTLTPAGRAMLNSPTPEAFREGVCRFLANDDFDEMNRINHIRGQGGRGKRYMSRPAIRRAAIWSSLRHWPVAQWASFDEAFRFVFASGNAFFTAVESMFLYIADAQYGSLYAEEPIDRQYTRAFLMESLGTLGLVDLAYVYPHGLWPEMGDNWGRDSYDFCGRYDGLLFVRLNSLGAYCLGLTDTWQPPQATHRNLFRILPNRDVVLCGDRRSLVGPDRHLLERFAVPRSDDVWRLDRDRILDHAETGGAVDDVRRFLAERSEGLPDNVSVWLDDLERGLGAVLGVSDAVLIKMADPVAAALVANDTKASSYALLAGERHVVVPAKRLRALNGVLRRYGFILPPARHHAAPASGETETHEQD
jgi:hypothetical protein